MACSTSHMWSPAVATVGKGSYGAAPPSCHGACFPRGRYYRRRREGAAVPCAPFILLGGPLLSGCSLHLSQGLLSTELMFPFPHLQADNHRGGGAARQRAERHVHRDQCEDWLQREAGRTHLLLIPGPAWPYVASGMVSLGLSPLSPQRASDWVGVARVPINPPPGEQAYPEVVTHARRKEHWPSGGCQENVIMRHHTAASHVALSHV